MCCWTQQQRPSGADLLPLPTRQQQLAYQIRKMQAHRAVMCTACTSGLSMSRRQVTARFQPFSVQHFTAPHNGASAVERGSQAACRRPCP